MTISTTSAARRFPAETSSTASGVSWRLLSWWCGLGCWLLAGCQAPQPSRELVRRSEPLLGTFVTITVYGENREELSAAVSAAFGEVRRVEGLRCIHRA